MTKKTYNNAPVDTPHIAGEMSKTAARKLLLESLPPLLWLAQKNGYHTTSTLLKEAIDELAAK